MWKIPRSFSLTGRLCCFPKDPLEDVETWSESVDKALSCKAGQIALREFLKSEYSEENILFWIAAGRVPHTQFLGATQRTVPRVQSADAMPSVVTSPPRELQHLNMDMEDKKRRLIRGRNCRLRCKWSQAASTEGFCFEEMSQWSQSLERLLSSKYGTNIFQAFLKSEFSDENIEFWQVCEDYKKIKSSFRMSSRAKKIFKRYIQAEAPREINIDHKTRELIKWNIKAPTTVCFDDAQRIVHGLMERDSYPRFLKSDIYQALMDSKPETGKL